MQISIVRQTPAASILLMLLLVAGAFLRFALAPYEDELIGGATALPGALVDSFQSGHPVWARILSAIILAANGVTLGKMTTALSLYPTRSTISIPLYAIVACGLFIATNSLSVALAAYFATQMLRYLCGGYVHGTDLNYAFYAALCAGTAPLFYAPDILLVVLLPIAVLMFGFSWREVVVAVVGLLLPLATTCYIGWLCGEALLAPAIGLFDAVATSADYTPWGSESVVALAMMGLLLFGALCGIATFFGDKRSVGVRPRTILAFHIVLLITACAAFALPSATTGLFTTLALPISVLFPVMLLRVRNEVSNLMVLLLVVLMIVHFFIA